VEKMNSLLTFTTKSSFKGGVGVYSDYLKKVFPSLRIVSCDSIADFNLRNQFFLLREPIAAKAVSEYFLKKYSDKNLAEQVIFTNGMFGWALKKKEVNAKIVSISHGCYASFADTAMKKTNPDYYRIRFLYSFFEKKSLSNADVRVSNSVFTQEKILEYYGLDSKVIYNAIDTALFKPSDKNKARQLLNLPLDKKIVIFVGRPNKTKGFDIIEALAKEQKDVLFLCVMYPEVVSVYKNIIVKSNIPNNQLNNYYSAADVCVFPSRYEGFGYVPIESLACNTPVIASNTGIMKEIKPKGSIVIEGFNPSDYSVALDKLLVKKSIIDSSEFIKEKFSILKFCEAYKKLLEN